MSGVRSYLNCLNRDALIRLQGRRDVSSSALLADRRTSLSRSYRGDLAALLDDLRVEDIREVIRQCTFTRDEKTFQFIGYTTLDKERLTHLLVRFHEGTYIPSEFVEIPRERNAEHGVSEQDEDEEDPSEGELDEGPADEEETDSADGDQSGFAQEYGPSWSRPLKITRLFRRLGEDAPVRLRAERFHSLVTSLRGMGLEVADEEGNLLDDAPESPGIDGKLRLRRLSTDPLDFPRQRQRARSAETITFVETGSAEGPSIREPVRSPATLDPGHVYTTALLRLQVLTSVPHHDRGVSGAWPTEFLASAIGQFQLTPGHQKLLSVAAAQFERGNHDPIGAASRLASHHPAEDWMWLLEQLLELNAPVAQSASEIGILIRESLRLSPAVDAPAAARNTAPMPGAPQARDLPAAAQPQREAEPAAVNTRGLGALDDLFD